MARFNFIFLTNGMSFNNISLTDIDVLLSGSWSGEERKGEETLLPELQELLEDGSKLQQTAKVVPIQLPEEDQYDIKLKVLVPELVKLYRSKLTESSHLILPPSSVRRKLVWENIEKQLYFLRNWKFNSRLNNKQITSDALKFWNNITRNSQLSELKSILQDRVFPLFMWLLYRKIISNTTKFETAARKLESIESVVLNGDPDKTQHLLCSSSRLLVQFWLWDFISKGKKLNNANTERLFEHLLPEWESNVSIRRPPAPVLYKNIYKTFVRKRTLKQHGLLEKILTLPFQDSRIDDYVYLGSVWISLQKKYAPPDAPGHTASKWVQNVYEDISENFTNLPITEFTKDALAVFYRRYYTTVFDHNLYQVILEHGLANMRINEHNIRDGNFDRVIPLIHNFLAKCYRKITDTDMLEQSLYSQLAEDIGQWFNANGKPDILKFIRIMKGVLEDMQDKNMQDKNTHRLELREFRTVEKFFLST